MSIHHIFAGLELHSQILQNAVDQMASLPGVGRRTALRLVLHMLKQNPEQVYAFANSFKELTEKISYCERCKNISETKVCSICTSPRRDESKVCVVEDVRDLMAVEQTSSYNGLYHVLNGVISPIDGIGPDDLFISDLIVRLEQEPIKEVILALSTTMEGETTNFYIYRKISHLELDVTTLSRGVAVGDQLQYADEITLGRSIQNRLPFEASLAR